MSKDKKEGSSLNTDGLSSSFAELMKEIFKDDPDYLSASDIDTALGVSSESADPIFIGEYMCQASKNRIVLSIPNIAVWAIVEFSDEDEVTKRILLSNDTSRFEIENTKIIESGECEIDARGRWTMPDCVLQLLDSTEVMLQGLFNYAELLTLKDYEKAEAKLYERLHNTDNKL